MNCSLNILFIAALALLGSYTLSAKITDNDQRINENIENFTPLYGFGEGIIDYIELEQPSIDTKAKKNHKPPVYFVLKLEKPALKKPEPWAIYGERFIGYTDVNSRIQLYKRNLDPKTLKKQKQPLEEEPIGDPIAILPGDYTQKYKDNDDQIYTISITIQDDWLPIEIEDSGWLSTDYKDARVLRANLDLSPLSPKLI